MSETNLFTDCMIDVETLSTSTKAVIVQIGTTFFNKDETPDIGTYASSSITLDKEEQERMGRVIDSDTLAFWLDQPKELFESVTKGEYNLASGLQLFKNQWRTYAGKNCVVWGKPEFDIALMKSLFEEINQSPPWKHYNVRSYMTYCTAFPVAKIKPKVHHDAMYDALAQAQTIQVCRQKRKDLYDAQYRLEGLDK